MNLTFDLVVIGGGPGGYVAAIEAAKAGMRVALLEKNRLGGACLNAGCIPTKSLLHAAHLYRSFSQAGDFGIRTGDVFVDLAGIQKRKDDVVETLVSGVSVLLQANGVTVFSAEGFVEGEGTVIASFEGGERKLLSTRYILLATGTAPARPNIPGIDLPGILTSDDLLRSLPPSMESLLIVGGGVIGVEMASVFQSFGIHTTIVEAEGRILPSFDREVSQSLSMAFKKRGVSIHPSTRVLSFEVGEEGLTCHAQTQKETLRLTAWHVLIAVGRKADTAANLFDPALPIETRDDAIVVNDSLQTGVPTIYAIGDLVAGSIKLAHAASAMGSNAVASMLGKPPGQDLRFIPACVYTDPEIASVGLTPEQAKAKGIAVKTGKYVLSGHGKSLLEGCERGFVKLLFDAETEALLGATLLCERATDLIGELTLALQRGLTAADLSAAVRPHPTYTEAIGEAVADLWRRAVHAMPPRR